ncbi:MAG: hypothetical protein IJF96_02280 [Firmicutes bacterium]|nr:hypothetical protein [Bacillota bacterium]
MRKIFLSLLISFALVFTSGQFVFAGEINDNINDMIPAKVPKTSLGVPAGSYTVSVANVSGGFTIQANIPAKYTQAPYYYVFGALFVDGTKVKDFTGETSIAKQKISLEKFSTGYHTAFLQLYDSNTGLLQRLIFKEKIKYNGITSKPTYKGVFDVYSKYFNYYPYNIAMENQAHPLYMEYKLLKARKWRRTGSMTANAIELYTSQGFKISKLKANKKYRTRIRYGTYAKYNKITPSDFDLTLEEFHKILGTSKNYIGTGKTYFFGGPALKTRTIKTGKAKKPKIKSVKVKAIKIRFHKHRVAGHYYWTGYSYIWIRPYTEKYYTCKYKVTIRLKKKPGTKGLYINGKYLKGNKKKYTTTFTPYPNYFTKKPPKGQRYKVKIRSYQSKQYNGFSPVYSRNKKVK